MKAEGHPTYNKVKIICRCGNILETRSVYPAAEMHIDVCSNCHPFYTGQQKVVSVAGKVDRFKEKFGG